MHLWGDRIKSSVVSHPNTTNCYIEVVEDLTVIDSEKDEADTQLEQVLLADPELELLELPLEHEHESEPELAYNLGEKKSWKEKVDCALQRIEALDKTVELLKSKVFYKFVFKTPCGCYFSCDSWLASLIYVQNM